ncbi:MAG: histidine kinase [Oscillospiraceae bacterium]
MRHLYEKTVWKIIDFFRRVNIFPRLICVMLGLSILPLLFITFFSFNQYVSEIKQNTEQYLSLLVGNVSIQVQERMESYEQIARAFYSDKETMRKVERNCELANASADYADNIEYRDNKRAIEEHLLALTQGSRFVQNFELVCQDEQYNMRNTAGEPRGAVIKDIDAFKKSDYYAKAIEGKGYPMWFDTVSNRNVIHKYSYSKNGIGNTLTMTVAIYSARSRTPIGVLMLNIDMRFLTQSLTNYAFYGTGNTFLLGRQDVLAILNPNINAPSLNYKGGLQNKIFGNAKGTFTQELDDSSVFVSFQKIKKMELYVAHIVDTKTILEPAFQIRRRCLLVVALLLIACIILARFTTESISSPLKNLLKNINSFKSNWFAERCETQGHDELTIVSNHFNEMADQTQCLVDEIVKSNITQKTLELSKTKAELNALQMQIDPHFLYNTLDIIRWETIRVGKGENDASRMIDSFCRLMRMSVKRGAEFVFVSKELEHAQAYVDVVNFRNANKIEFVSLLEFNTSQHCIPKLTLQPLIENAIVHGFDKNMQNPTIYLRGWKLSNILLITITDNGKGMSSSELQSLRESFSGEKMMQNSIGLRNVNQRFKLCYGEEYGITLESVQNTGTEVTLRIPLEFADNQELN